MSVRMYREPETKPNSVYSGARRPEGGGVKGLTPRYRKVCANSVVRLVFALIIRGVKE